MTPRSPQPHLARRALALAAFAVAAAGCSGGSSDETDEPTTDPTEEAAGTSEASDSTTSTAASDPTATSTEAPVTSEPVKDGIDWSECDLGECASIFVPVDPSDPSLGDLEIAINIHRATDPARRIGVLLVNPGGPGESGRELAALGDAQFGEEVAARFDIVGFDPRGVGDSEPTFECGADGEQLALEASMTFPYDDAEVAAAEEAVGLCTESMGPVASRLGSRFVAADMDAIREALGEQTISFMGYSYGSALGTWYASLYPEHVRAMVLDGAEEVVQDVSTQEARISAAVDDLTAMESTLAEALEACEAEQCPLAVDGDATAGYLAAMERKQLVVDATGNPSAPVLGVVTFLYDETTWPALWEALVALRDDGDVEPLVDSYRFQQPTDGASFTSHVNCLDSWALYPEIDRQTQLDDGQVGEERAEAAAPLLWAAIVEGGELCAFFDVLDVEPAPVVIDGGGVPILVIGNRSDPVTSFQDSERLATEVLSNGYLVDTDHFQHTVFPFNDCVNELVFDVLFDASYPDERTVTCARQEPTSATLVPVLRYLCPILDDALGADGSRDPEEVCEDFVGAMTEEYSFEELQALIESSDPDDAQVFVETYLAAMDE